MRKPSTCWCPGSRKDKSWRWGCLKREENRVRLYCKTCRHEWWSKRRYAAQIPDWKKRGRSGMTDQDILDRILAGTLLVREEGGLVIVETLGHRAAILKQEERAVHEYTSYRFVSVCVNGRKKKVAVHKLNWMFHNRSLVPEGFHVDHENGRGDVIDNLRLLPAAVNCATNATEELF